MFCSSCGKEVAADKSFCTSCGAPAPQADAAPAVEQSTGEARPKRTGMIVGSVVAVIVVLAGAGVGLWLGLRGDDGGTAAGSTTTPVDGSGTVATIPGLEGGTDTTAQGGGLAGYRIAVEDLVRELDFDNGRIPELADMINATTPDVSQGVYDDLALMLQRTQAAHDAVAEIAPPPAFEQATLYLMQATLHMEARIRAPWTASRRGGTLGLPVPRGPSTTRGESSAMPTWPRWSSSSTTYRRALCRETEGGMAETVKYYPLVVGGVERSYPHVHAGAGKYAAAVVAGNLVFLSGMTAESDEDGSCSGRHHRGTGDNCLEKVRRHLEEVGSSLENVVKDLIILKDMEYYQRMRATELAYYQKYAPRLVSEPPASTIFQPAALGRPEFLVEWEVVAVVSREA